MEVLFFISVILALLSVIIFLLFNKRIKSRWLGYCLDALCCSLLVVPLVLLLCVALKQG